MCLIQLCAAAKAFLRLAKACIWEITCLGKKKNTMTTVKDALTEKILDTLLLYNYLDDMSGLSMLHLPISVQRNIHACRSRSTTAHRAFCVLSCGYC